MERRDHVLVLDTPLALSSQMDSLVESLEDPTGPLPLTPNHVLVMKPEGILPPPGVFDEADLYAKKQWRKVQHLSNEFWRLWRKDFFMTLQVRRKWQKRQPNVEVGDIVILHCDGVFRADWRLARVIEVYPGQDGLVRSCKVRVA
ncbi:hypothetical protein ACOMHN_011254 [Nucella lapillus]